jgi:hypothetical protein
VEQEPVVEPAPVAELIVEPVPTPAPGAPPSDPEGPRPFVAAVLQTRDDAEGFFGSAHGPALRQQIANVIADEQPIVPDRLIRLVARGWGVGRVTERVRQRVRELLPAAVVEQGGALFADAASAAAFAGFRTADDGARGAEELPAVEVEHAMLWLLRQHLALSADDLARETARCFGITRLGSVVRAVMDEALERLCAMGRAWRDGETVRLPG